MATEIERAIIELQVVCRGLHQRLAAIEHGQPAQPGTPSAHPDAPPSQPKESPPSPPAAAPPSATVPPPAPVAAVQPTVLHPAPAAQNVVPKILKPAPPAADVEFTFAKYNARVQTLLQQIAQRNHSIDASFENIIGQSVVSLVGAVVLFAGILLFLRFPFVQSWLQPAHRVLDCVIAGVVFIAAGQWFHHARMKPLSGAMTGTGLMTLLAALFAANIGFTPMVLGQTAAFAGTVIVGVAGIALALQLRQEVLAILSLVALYLIPLILHAEIVDPRLLFAYLAVVSCLALAVCFYKQRWHWVRAVSLLALAAPFYFDGVLGTYAWILASFALGLYALLAGSINARTGMFSILVLLGFRILLFDSIDPLLIQPFLALPQLSITPWMILAASAAIFTLVLAWLASRKPVITPREYRRPNWIIIGCIVTGSVLWYACVFSTLEPRQLCTLASLAWIFAIIALGRMLFTAQEAPLIETIAAVFLTATCAKWIVFDGLSSALADPMKMQLLPGTHIAVSPIANIFVLNGILILLAFRATRILHQLGRSFFGWFITALAFVALIVETLRIVSFTAPAALDPWFVSNLCISIVAAVYALGLSIFGFARKYPPARWVALVIFAVTVLKVLIIDLANIDNSLRILSFLIVGPLLLIVSFLYHKSSLPARAEPAV